MKYAYTAKPVEGYMHLNPEFWAISSPRADATEVLVDQGFDNIAAHYETAGAKVVMSSDVDSIEPVAGELTKEAIAEMGKANVIELLEAHGIDPDGRRSVAFLRDELTATMFVDI